MSVVKAFSIYKLNLLLYSLGFSHVQVLNIGAESFSSRNVYLVGRFFKILFNNGFFINVCKLQGGTVA